MRDTILIAANAADRSVRYQSPAIVRTSSRALLLAYACLPDNDEETPYAGSVIKLQRSFDHGLTWSDPIIVYGEEEPNPHEGYCWPSFIVDLVTGQVFLMATQYLGADDPEENQSNLVRILLAFSEDDGETWRSRDISTQVNGANRWRSRQGTPGHGVQLKQGIWTGRMVQAIRVVDPDGQPCVVTVCSDDHGRTWWSGKPIPGNAKGAGVVELSDGRVVLQVPEEVDGNIHVKRYYSMDGARSFGPGLVAPHPPALEVNDDEAADEGLSSEAAQFAAMLARAGLLGEDDNEEDNAKAPRWSNSVERAFPCAIPGMDQARVVILPTLTPLDPSDDDIELGVTVSTNDGQTTYRQTAYIDKKVHDVDTVSLPDMRLLMAVVETDDGIEVSHVCLDSVGLKDFAYGWNERPDNQEDMLKTLGFIN